MSKKTEPATSATPPFPNCRYQICDLPGQCVMEGKCHHPRYAASATPELPEDYDLLRAHAIALRADLGRVTAGTWSKELARLSTALSDAQAKQYSGHWYRRAIAAEAALASTAAPGGNMTRDKLLEIARECARSKPESYYSEPFQPHEWVLDAMAKVDALARTAAPEPLHGKDAYQLSDGAITAAPEPLHGKDAYQLSDGAITAAPEPEANAAGPSPGRDSIVNILKNAIAMAELEYRNKADIPCRNLTTPFMQDIINALSVPPAKVPSPERVREIATIHLNRLTNGFVDLQNAVEQAINQALAEAAEPPSGGGWLNVDQLNLCRQWCNAVQDVSPKYLDDNDYVLRDYIVKIIKAAEPPAGESK